MSKNRVPEWTKEAAQILRTQYKSEINRLSEAALRNCFSTAAKKLNMQAEQLTVVSADVASIGPHGKNNLQLQVQCRFKCKGMEKQISIHVECRSHFLENKTAEENASVFMQHDLVPINQDKIIEQIKSAVRDGAKKLQKKAKKKGTVPSNDPGMNFFTEIMRLKQDITGSIQLNIRKAVLAAIESCPGDETVQLYQRVQCDVRISTFKSFSPSISADIGFIYNKSESLSCTVSKDLGSFMVEFTTDETKCLEHIRELLCSQKMTDFLVSKVLEKLPCGLVARGKIHDFVLSNINYLHSNPENIKWECSVPSKNSRLYLCADGTYCVKGMSRKDVSFSKTEIQSAMDFQTGNRTPANLLEFSLFCQKFAELYKCSSGEFTYPITFVFDKNQIQSYSVHTVTRNISDEWNPVKGQSESLTEKINAIIKQVNKITESFSECQRRQIEVLNTLNDSELKILRYIFAQGKSWYTDITSAIERDDVLTTKVSAGHYLDHLCELKIEGANGETKPLVCFDWIDGKHGDFRLYKPEADILPGALALAKPRPFTNDEISDLTSDGRVKWMKYMAEQANDQQSRWTALQTLEHMPKTLVVEFVKSDDGRRFFSEFKDEDAIYARFFLENTPGCKKIAKEIFEN